MGPPAGAGRARGGPPKRSRVACCGPNAKASSACPRTRSRAQAVKAARDASERAARQLAQQSSEIGDERPIGGCAFSPDGSLLAACGWGGAVNLWRATDSANVARVRGFRAHPERATGIAWHPQATLSQPEGAANILTGCADGSAALFSADGQQLLRLEGHTERLGRVAWHPMGRHVVSARPRWVAAVALDWGRAPSAATEASRPVPRLGRTLSRRARAAPPLPPPPPPFPSPPKGHLQL